MVVGVLMAPCWARDKPLSSRGLDHVLRVVFQRSPPGRGARADMVGSEAFMSESGFLPTPEQDAAVTPIMGHPLKRQVLVCTSKSCTANGSEAVQLFDVHTS